MSSYPAYTGEGSQAGAASSSSTAGDPYAPFYYWDANANDWAFDYASYYASYGYPADYYTGGCAASADYDANHRPNWAAETAYDANHRPVAAWAEQPAAAARAPAEEQRFDEHGRAIPGKLKRGETRTTVLRRAAGKLWEDQTLLEWDPTHKRLFVGDLGNDVSDETLAAAFAKYPSFSRARVVRTKDGKSKGYGFVAFADPHDFLAAWKQVDGKYIGSRPCRLKKAADVVNPVAIGARKDRLLAISAKYDAEAYKTKMGGAVGKNLRRAGVGKPYGK
jgi:hypothetical protein